MPKKPPPQEHVHYHRDGSIWARGPIVDGVMSGYWEWYRKDGTRMRSGHFERGAQAGEWTTYDRNGAVVKVTRMKPKPKPEATAKAPPVARKMSATKAKAPKKR